MTGQDEPRELTFSLNKTPTGKIGDHVVKFKRPDSKSQFPWLALSYRVADYLQGDLDLADPEGEGDFDFEAVTYSLHHYSTHLDGVRGRLSLRQLREELPPLMSFGLWAQFYQSLQLSGAQKKSSADTSEDPSVPAKIALPDTANAGNGSAAAAPT